MKGCEEGRTNEALIYHLVRVLWVKGELCKQKKSFLFKMKLRVILIFNKLSLNNSHFNFLARLPDSDR